MRRLLSSRERSPPSEGIVSLTSVREIPPVDSSSKANSSAYEVDAGRAHQLPQQLHSGADQAFMDSMSSAISSAVAQEIHARVVIAISQSVESVLKVHEERVIRHIQDTFLTLFESGPIRPCGAEGTAGVGSRTCQWRPGRTRSSAGGGSSSLGGVQEERASATEALGGHTSSGSRPGKAQKQVDTELETPQQPLAPNKPAMWNAMKQLVRGTSEHRDAPPALDLLQDAYADTLFSEHHIGQRSTDSMCCNPRFQRSIRARAQRSRQGQGLNDPLNARVLQVSPRTTPAALVQRDSSPDSGLAFDPPSSPADGTEASKGWKVGIVLAGDSKAGESGQSDAGLAANHISATSANGNADLTLDMSQDEFTGQDCPSSSIGKRDHKGQHQLEAKEVSCALEPPGTVTTLGRSSGDAAVASSSETAPRDSPEGHISEKSAPSIESVHTGQVERTNTFTHVPSLKKSQSHSFAEPPNERKTLRRHTLSGYYDINVTGHPSATDGPSSPEPISPSPSINSRHSQSSNRNWLTVPDATAPQHHSRHSSATFHAVSPQAQERNPCRAGSSHPPSREGSSRGFMERLRHRLSERFGPAVDEVEILRQARESELLQEIEDDFSDIKSVGSPIGSDLSGTGEKARIHCEARARHAGSPLLLRVWGILPWTSCCQRSTASQEAPWWSLSGLYLRGVALLALLAVAFCVENLVVLQRAALRDAEAGSSVVLHFQEVVDLIVAVGSFLGLLLIRSSLVRLNILGNKKAMLVGFARRERLLDAWTHVTGRETPMLGLVWILVVASRASASASPVVYDGISSMMAVARSGLSVVVFAFTSGLFLALTQSIQHVVLLLPMMVDAFCFHFYKRPYLDDNVRDWSLLQAALRRASNALERCFLVLETSTLVAVLTSVTAMALTPEEPSQHVWLLAAVLLLAAVEARLFFKAAEVTEKCQRVPSLVNSMCFGEDVDADRHYLVEYVTYSAAGFYVFQVRLTAAMALKLAYVSGLLAFAMATNIASKW